MCINPEHLILGTHADNVADRVSRGRSATGVKNGRAKLTEDQVREILASTDRHIVLSKKYGVTPKVVRLVRRRAIWKTVV